ncbi:MAG: imidazolonepropionase [Planctomycetes bacterium]|nr:imidazolonepropionase [Planctomycetota bacterium]
MEPSAQKVDLLVTGIGELASALGSSPAGGAALGRVSRIEDAALAIEGAQIVGVGPEAEVRESFEAAETLDAAGKVVLPGLVDAHTHPVFAGTREDEFEMRLSGKTYVEIAAAGGGIASSVRGVRETSKEELTARLLVRLDRFLALGTTTVEAKTGYGLSLEDELKCLEVIRDAAAQHPVELVPTFLGAHDYPPEFKDRKPEYVDLLLEEMLPAVAESGLAEYADVFTESHVFGIEDSRRIMARASELGLRLRLHVDQLTPLGGAELAAELGADSADHLECISDEGIAALGEAGVVPVLCPLVPLFIGQEEEAPGRRIIDLGLAPAVATDFNPGSCYVQSLPEALSWAALRYGMSAAECLVSATLNAACSLQRGDRLGTLEVGKQADLVITDLPRLEHLSYELGRSPVQAVIKRGEVVYQRGGAA